MEELKKINQSITLPDKLSFEEAIKLAKTMTPAEYEQYRVDSLNAMTGDLDKDDGYNCPICKNKGLIYKLVEQNGYLYQTGDECKCRQIRSTIRKMKRSGLKDVIKDCTFEKWIASEEWQKTIKAAAVEYAKDPKGWFFIGGQSGCGKTHLCTAICRELLLKGKGVQYMQWREDAVKLKGMANDPEHREPLIDRFKKAEVLYIDDLFKTGKNPDGGDLKPTSADINLAFEILNFRYNCPESLTIISSELCTEELIDIDEATGGRIFERAKAFAIAKDKKKNYRTKKQIVL